MSVNNGQSLPALVVDDEADIRDLLSLSLRRMGLDTDTAATITQAKKLLAEHRYRLCLTDMRLPDGDGLSLVREIAQRYPDIPVAVITAHGNMDNAVAALKAGAYDYLSKPVSLDQLRDLVRTATEETPSQSRTHCDTLVGNSPVLQQLRERIARVARSQAPVYISGESGSGKELAARLLHNNSSRAQGPFVPVNCGAIPETLMESEFFGYRKGAFTGAEKDRDGFFQAAERGTLFLDEVADLPLSMQVKLLRAIQEKSVRRLGDPKEKPIDVRLICATHRDLKKLVEEGRFRQDLFYRINVIDLHMPALREYAEDISLISHAWFDRQSKTQGLSPVPSLSEEALALLKRYPFPGNVRELENILERALALATQMPIGAADLQLDSALCTLETADSGETFTPGHQALQEYLDHVERQAIQEALRQSRFNITASARLLGVTFRSLRYRMERLGLKE
jgi:two-component system response regulator PilR (NtrC family)